METNNLIAVYPFTNVGKSFGCEFESYDDAVEYLEERGGGYLLTEYAFVDWEDIAEWGEDDLLEGGWLPVYVVQIGPETCERRMSFFVNSAEEAMEEVKRMLDSGEITITSDMVPIKDVTPVVGPVVAEAEGNIGVFDATEIEDWIGYDLTPEEIQEIANILVCNLEMPSEINDDGTIEITRSNFNDSFGDMEADLRNIYR